MLYEAWMFAWMAVASIWDLKHAEVKDLFPVVIGGSGFVFHGYTAFVTGSWVPVLSSVAVGAVCLAAGVYAMWHGLWKEGDVVLIGALGVAFPRFQLFLIASVATVGVIYTYAWKYVTGESKARMVPVFPLALLGLYVLFP